MLELEVLYSHMQKSIIIPVPKDKKVEPCMYCGNEDLTLYARLSYYGMDGAWVHCRKCGACGPVGNIRALIINECTMSTPATEESLETGKKDAIDSWNQRKRCSSRRLIREVTSSQLSRL